MLGSQFGGHGLKAGSGGPRVLVSLATYKERENLETLLPCVLEHAPGADVLVVDDNSPDGTADFVRSFGDPRVRLLLRPGKLGLGSAILAGMRHALEGHYDLFVNMDADFSHHPRHLPALIGGMHQHDVMIGSRYVPGGGTVGWPLSRWLISRSVNALTRFLFRLRARDTSGAYRCYRVGMLREARLDRVRSRGYSFQQEVLYRCVKAGARVGETPIVFEERRAGSSKVDLRESVRSLAQLLKLGVPAFFGYD
ncbi:MAG: polyprenol monophosphomannose synthase [Gemmataceae bacterium]|nr:polyprenol monophosphomannose synthase [Gemmataceae bacterium]